jgi:hypothetical protein
MCLHHLSEGVTYAGSTYASRLGAIQTGRKQAYDYQQIVADILSYLFSEDLAQPHMEVENASGTSRYDIVFLNKAGDGFWHDMKIMQGNSLLIFDAKNKKNLVPADADQMLRYASDWRGNIVFMVCRKEPNAAFLRRTREMLSEKRVYLLVLTDCDLENMLVLKGQGSDPATVIEDKYRALLETA